MYQFYLASDSHFLRLSSSIRAFTEQACIYWSPDFFFNLALFYFSLHANDLPLFANTCSMTYPSSNSWRPSFTQQLMCLIKITNMWLLNVTVIEGLYDCQWFQQWATLLKSSEPLQCMPRDILFPIPSLFQHYYFFWISLHRDLEQQRPFFLLPSLLLDP